MSAKAPKGRTKRRSSTGKASLHTVAMALRSGSSIATAVLTGMTALGKSDRKLIHESIRPEIGDGINLDEATRIAFPNQNRWDYVLSVPNRKLLIGVEPHSANDGELSVVIKKRNNAVDFLADQLKPGERVARWYWVTRGKVNFSNTEKARRALDQNGIRFVGRMLSDFE